MEGVGGSAAGGAQMGRNSLEPQVSTQGLRFKGFPKLPNIGDVVAETVVAQAPAVAPQQVAPAQPEAEEQVVPETAEAEPVVEQPEPEVESAASETVAENFEDSWLKLVDDLFKKKPAFYHQLRDYLPKFENNVIYVDVENDFQRNKIEAMKRAMTEYWNENFTTKITDIELVIHEHEKKKIIYTNEDKVENMVAQNPQLKDFLQVLNFRIKD